MFVRRRPLLRAAAVGGGAYIAGKRSAQRSVQDQSMQDQSMQDQSMQQDMLAGQVPAQASEPSVSDQLSKLSSLHEQGSLSDAEFAAAKARLLGN
jgi:hypothetical protein